MTDLFCGIGFLFLPMKFQPGERKIAIFLDGVIREIQAVCNFSLIHSIEEFEGEGKSTLPGGLSPTDRVLR